jgi:hypothetical protein
MKLFKEIRYDIRLIGENKIDYLFLFFQLIVFQGSIKQFNNDAFIIINLILCFLFNIFRKRLTFKGLFLIIVIITAILFLPTFQWGINNSFTFIGFYIRIITAFLIISYFRINFFRNYEKIIFLLTFISIPLFILQIININVFDIFRSFSEKVLPEELLHFGFGKLEGHRYLIIFNVNSWAELRNSGFAGEPAAFGALLTWAAIINSFQNNFKVNFRFYIYIIAAITTFSISTYVAFSLFFLFILLNTNKLGKAFYLVFVVIAIVSLFYLPLFQERTQFMKNKLNSYSLSIEDTDYKESIISRRNRIQGFIVGIDLIKKSPLGYSIDPNKAPDAIKSSNGFMLLLFKFGIIGFVLIMYLIKEIFEFLKKNICPNAKGLYAFIFIILITFNGNPFYNQPFFLSFLLSGFLILSFIRRKNKQAITIYYNKNV